MSVSGSDVESIGKGVGVAFMVASLSGFIKQTMEIVWIVLLLLLLYTVLLNKKLLNRYFNSIVGGYFMFLGFSSYITLYLDKNDPTKSLEWLLLVAGFSYLAGLIIPNVVNAKSDEERKHTELSRNLLIMAGLLIIIGLSFQGYSLIEFPYNVSFFLFGAALSTFAVFILMIALCDLFLILLSQLIVAVKETD